MPKSILVVVLLYVKMASNSSKKQYKIHKPQIANLDDNSTFSISIPKLSNSKIQQYHNSPNFNEIPINFGETISIENKTQEQNL